MIYYPAPPLTSSLSLPLLLSLPLFPSFPLSRFLFPSFLT